MNVNIAPYPDALREIVDTATYRPGWLLSLVDDFDRGQGSRGLTFIVITKTVNSYKPDEPIRVQHLFPVPPAAYDRDSWQRWVLSQLLLVEQHEACEFFTVAGVKPYAPNHGPGRDPYVIHDYATEEQAATRFTGAPAGKGREASPQMEGTS